MSILSSDTSTAIDFGNLEFLAQQIVAGFITGLHKSPFHGFSVEFAEHSLYNSGDSVKNVDWKLFARTDKLFVKRFEEETNLRCQIIIDASSSMYFPKSEVNKFQFSALASAALILLLKKQRDAFGLTLFSFVFLDTGYALSCIQNALKLGCKKSQQHQARAFK